LNTLSSMRQTTEFEHRVSELIEASIATKQCMRSSSEVVLTVAKVGEILVTALKLGNKVLLFGNGGGPPYLHWPYL
jgi:phosphoheptose isomerase